MGRQSNRHPGGNGALLKPSGVLVSYVVPVHVIAESDLSAIRMSSPGCGFNRYSSLIANILLGSSGSIITAKSLFASLH